MGSEIDRMAKEFGLAEENDNDTVKLRVVVVGDILTLFAKRGSTIGELKEENGYEDTVKITDKCGIPLRNDYVIDTDMDLYLSVPKSNG